jgi:hypothetical protein
MLAPLLDKTAMPVLSQNNGITYREQFEHLRGDGKWGGSWLDDLAAFKFSADIYSLA